MTKLQCKLKRKKKKVAINNPYCPYIFTLRSRETLQPFISKECVCTCMCTMEKTNSKQNNSKQVRMLGKLEIHKLAGLMNFLAGCSSVTGHS